MAVILSQPENGQIVMLANGNLGYTPNPGFIGTDQFTYAPSDGAATLGLLVTVDLTVEAPGGVPSEAIPSGINQPSDLRDTSPNDSSSNDSDLDLDNELDNEIDDAASDEVDIDLDQSNDLDSLPPIASIEPNDGAGADTLANDSTLDGSDEFSFETFRENLIASGIANQENAAASLLSLANLTDYSTRASEEKIAELGRYAVAAVAYDAELLWSQLDDIEASFEVEFGKVSFSIGAVSAFGAAGYILWTLRGGVLMAAAMSQLPSWKMVDPLPVLDSYSNDRNETGEDDVTGFFD